MISYQRFGRLLLPLLLALLGATVTLAAACSGGGSDATVCSPDIVSIQQQIFLRSCAQQACHGATEPAAFLNLATEDIVGQLVGVPSSTCDGATRVVPGSPEQSFLYKKLTTATPGCGDGMPPGGSLSADEKECVRQWIAAQLPLDGGVDGPNPCETCGGSQCVDLSADPAHCGGCNAPCPPGASCAGGTCACGGALMACGSSCVDTTFDSAHCGGCNSPCPSGAICAASQCECASGLEVCAGACVDMSSDPAHCGGCANACAGVQVCNTGVCSATCGTLTKCGASCVNTDTSTGHCGGCGMACPAGASCVGGSCQCPPGTSACGGSCINTATDPANCGGCGNVCAQGTVCQSSACVCPGGGTVCGPTCVDTQTDPANCGTCGNACAVGQSCSAGSCSCGTMSVSFAAAVQPIFTASCAANGCHKGVMPQEGLDLTSGKAYQELVNVNATQCNDGRKLVLPGQPSQSYVIDKMMGVDLCFGTKMPKLGMLPSTQVETVANWICAGAPNN
jgi:hypothetical protein